MEFAKSFQITKKILFNVRYTTLGSNADPYFATDASEFNQPKSDYRRCGQAQDALLPKGSVARKFWEKWDEKHLKKLTDEEIAELLADCEHMEEFYNCFTVEHEKFGTQYRTPSFGALKEFSKLPTKKEQRRIEEREARKAARAAKSSK